MSDPRFITLEEWMKRTYGDAIPISTARRWARKGKIYPRPEKHGRHYYVTPDARYTDRPGEPPRLRLVDRIRATAT